MLRDVDPDLQRSLELPQASGALVQDVTEASPGDRAGLRTYDLIVAVDGRAIAGNDELIELIASRAPGSVASLQVVRDRRPINVDVKLAERPRRARRAESSEAPQPTSRRDMGLGLLVRELDGGFSERFRLPDNVDGVIVSRVEPLSPAFDADIERGHVVLEVNRKPVRTIDDYRRLTAEARSGDIFTLYVYKPELDGGQRALHTVKVD
jgi:serine protease Do